MFQANQRRKRIIIGIVAGVAILGAVLLFSFLSQPETLPALRLAARDTTVLLTVTGTVKADRSVAISPPAQARLELVLADEGDVVQPGSVVAVLEQASVQATLAEAQARLAEASARLQTVRSGSRPETVSRLSEVVSQGELQSAALQASLAAAIAQRDDARRNAGRLSRLFKEGAVSRQEFEQATVRAKTTSDEVDRLAAEIQARRAAIGQARAQYQEARQGNRPSEIAEANAARSAAQAAVKASQVALNERSIITPIGGIVTERLQEPGELAVPGQPILRIADPTSLELEASVEEADISRVELGNEAFVVLDARPNQSLPAIVTKIGSRVANESGTIPVTIRLNASSAQGLRLLPGMQGDISIVTHRLHHALVVPTSAVMEEGGQPTVFRFADERLQQVPVRIRRLSRESVEILSGVKANDLIVLTPNPEKQKPGQRFRPVPAANDPTEQTGAAGDTYRPMMGGRAGGASR